MMKGITVPASQKAARATLSPIANLRKYSVSETLDPARSMRRSLPG